MIPLLLHAKLIWHLKALVQLALNSATECLSDGEDRCVPRLTMEVKCRIERRSSENRPLPPPVTYATAIHPLWGHIAKHGSTFHKFQSKHHPFLILIIFALLSVWIFYVTLIKKDATE